MYISKIFKNKMSNRPLLKGYSHLISTFIYLFTFPYLISLIPTELKFPFTIYVLSIICNFGCSTLLHVIPWNKNSEIYMRRLDHIMIFFNIDATYYAAISTIMYDINPLVIYILFIGTITGVITRLFFTDAPKIFISLPYFIIGWAIIFDPYTFLNIIERTPEGSMIAFMGGISYTLGALIYTMEYPKLWPKYMSYHELFHIFSIIGSTLMAVCLFKYGIPYYLKNFSINKDGSSINF
jgi:hemolysin III